MTGPSSFVCYNCSCCFHNRLPIWSRCVRNQDFSWFKRGQILNVRNHTSLSRSNFVSYTPAFCKNPRSFFKYIAFQNFFAFLGLDGFWPCLDYKKFSCYAIFCPFDVYWTWFPILIRIVVFDSNRIPCKFKYFPVINTEAKLLSFRNFYVSSEHFGVSATVNHLDLFVSHFFLNNRLIYFPESRLE